MDLFLFLINFLKLYASRDEIASIAIQYSLKPFILQALNDFFTPPT
jgi:hypothetical protein